MLFKQPVLEYNVTFVWGPRVISNIFSNLAGGVVLAQTACLHQLVSTTVRVSADTAPVESHC